ncbi:SIS domain-containing protein [Actinopolymorpha pittospori]|uniref:Tagatose-6-phosphate ketose/aldose isomerase n=1 Tax=Actinopolymorpha pittospori TaxID=648752 RepID=A0A927RKJ2_9ACTN|nr:tagatose-6-phosphate ketose/aldose isomerase [Actinopolymorpha pittospori]
MTSSTGTASRGAGAEATTREIAQQPRLWREVERLVSARRASLEEFLAPLVAHENLRVVLAGAGTSHHVGQILATTLARRLGRRVEAIATTDIVADPHGSFAQDVPTLLVSFARSGDSPESVATTELAEQCLSECHHLVITCNSAGHLARTHAERPKSQVLLLPAESNDEGFAMTSSFTCMTLAALLTLGGTSYDGLGDRLAAAAERVLATVDAKAHTLVDQAPERLVYLGSGALRGLAAESALKVLELTAGQIVATSESSLGFRHGPKAIRNDNTVVITYVSNDPYTRQYDLDIVAELLEGARPGGVVTVAASTAGLPEESTWLLEGLEDVDDAALALPAIVCAQLIGLYASLGLGLTPDNPFPSGEVNRVVQGVTLHRLRA